MINYVLTGGTEPSFDDKEKLTSMKNVYYNESSDDVRAIQWVCADGFYPRITIRNDESSNAKTGSLSDDVIKKADGKLDTMALDKAAMELRLICSIT